MSIRQVSTFSGPANHNSMQTDAKVDCENNDFRKEQCNCICYENGDNYVSTCDRGRIVDANDADVDDDGDGDGECIDIKKYSYIDFKTHYTYSELGGDNFTNSFIPADDHIPITNNIRLTDYIYLG
jgi:hypothetical protein